MTIVSHGFCARQGAVSLSHAAFAVSTCEKLESTIPGYRPEWTVRRGAEELLGEYMRCGLTLDDLNGWRLQRIARVKHHLEQGTVTSDLRPVAAGGEEQSVA